VDAQDEDQIQRYFAFYYTTKAEHNIHDNDVYNMNEKGVIVKVLAKQKVVCSRTNKKPYMTQPGNQEWVSLIKCVSSDRQVLSP